MKTNESRNLTKLLKIFVNNKKELLELLKEKKGVGLSEKLTYAEIISKMGEKELLSLFELESVREGYRKLDVLNLIYHSCVLNEVNLLAKELGIPKKGKKETVTNIVFSRKFDEEKIGYAIKSLHAKKKFSGVYQFSNIVIGPKGIIDSCSERTSTDIIDFLNEITKSNLKNIYQSLKIKEKATTEDEIKQLLLVNNTDEKIIETTNKLINRKMIDLPKMPTWSSIVVTPCGLYKKEDGTNPRESLKNFLLEYVDKDDLKLVIARELNLEDDMVDSELDRYLLEYVLEKSPENIINNFFDNPGIIRLSENLFKYKPNNDISFNEIINCILSSLGFIVPPKLIGLRDYEDKINHILDKSKFTIEDTAIIARETDNILRNIIQFFCKFIWEIDYDFYKFINDKFKLRDFSKLSSGKLVEILRLIDQIVKDDAAIRNKLYLQFNHQDFILSPESYEILNSWVSHRNNVIKRSEKLDKKTVESLINLAENIKKIYPLIVRVEKEETDKYNTHFICLIDDRDIKHRIFRTYYLQPIPYFLSPKYRTRGDRTIVDPFIVKIE